MPYVISFMVPHLTKQDFTLMLQIYLHSRELGTRIYVHYKLHYKLEISITFILFLELGTRMGGGKDEG